MNPIRLHYPPYGIFSSSRTPPGLYARQKWLGEESRKRWQADFEITVAELCRGRSDDGLWPGPPIETIQRLFDLHLTLRNADQQIHRGINAMLAMASHSGLAGDPIVLTTRQLRGLPFTPARRQAVILPAVLFLATIFGRASDPTVLRLYDRAASDLMGSPLGRQEPAFLCNLLRAFVVHPRFGNHPATREVAGWLADRQTPHGDWGADIPFYQIVNALAHLNAPVANRQCERAFGHLVNSQGADGAWGETDRQWCTFLAVHALRSKGMR